MTHKEKVGAAVIIAVFVVLGIVLWFTITPPADNTRSIENNVIIDQRIKNLNKSQ